MTRTLTLDIPAAGRLADRVDRSGGMLRAGADRLGGGVAAPADPWRADAALSEVTGVACARLLAVASDFVYTADALRAALVSYGTADDRSAARLAALGERPW